MLNGFHNCLYFTGISALAGLINAADMSLEWPACGIGGCFKLALTFTLSKHLNYRFFCNMFLSIVLFFVFLLPLSQMRCTIQPANGGKIMLNSVFLPPPPLLVHEFWVFNISTTSDRLFFPIQREMQRALFLSILFVSVSLIQPLNWILLRLRWQKLYASDFWLGYLQRLRKILGLVFVKAMLKFWGSKCKEISYVIGSGSGSLSICKSTFQIFLLLF